MLLFVPCIAVVLLVKVKRPKVQRDCVCVCVVGGGGGAYVRMCAVSVESGPKM